MANLSTADINFVHELERIQVKKAMYLIRMI